MQDMRILSGPHLRFLSCLYGSEHENTNFFISEIFLSCLYGSERASPVVRVSIFFLSCLYGSERIN